MPFIFEKTSISDVILIKTQIFSDERGQLLEIFKASDFEAAGITLPFVQDNVTRSRWGVLRGLHYQAPPHAQGKLITVLEGDIYDVAVDIRRGSPTYGEFVGMRLSSGDGRMLFIPVGFAHGFQALSEEAVVGYKLTAAYAPDFERGIRWDDPSLSIPWPIEEPILSGKDQRWPRLKDAEAHFTYQEEGA